MHTPRIALTQYGILSGEYSLLGRLGAGWVSRLLCLFAVPICYRLIGFLRFQ